VKLYYSNLSPYSRKARVIVRELDIKLKEIETVARGNMEFRRINPLGKIPVLVLDDGSALFDSPVICEYLNQFGGGKFFPGMTIWRQTSGRWKALGLQALGDGIMDAAVACIYEERFRTPEQRSEAVTANNVSVIGTALDALERVTFAKDPTIGEITVGCALGYIDLRLAHLEWRATRPKLAAWYEKFSQYPSMLATAPK
jgi:glutathione S-transferase